MKKITIHQFIFWVVLFFIGNPLFAQQQVDFTLKYNTSTSEYEVYGKPTLSGSFSVGGGSQLSVLIPSSYPDAAIASVTSVLGGPWADNSQIYAPSALSSMDFHSITTNGTALPINFIADQEHLIYKFTLTGGCVAGVRLYRNAAEGAAPRDPDSNGAGMQGSDFENYFAPVQTGNQEYRANYNNTGNSCGPGPVADLITTIGQPATPFVVGTSSDVPVTVTNQGTAPTTGAITTSITVPSGMTVPATFTSGTNSCTTSGQTVTCVDPGPISNVAPNNTSVIQVPMTPTAAIAGTSPSTSATSSTPGETDTSNNPASPMTPSSPITGVSDLVTTIGQPATPFVVGSPSNVPVTVTNVGSAPATGPIATTITLPTGMTAPATFTSNGNTCTTSGQTVSCSNPDPLSNAAPNNTNTIQVPMTPTAAIAGTSPQTTATTSAPNEPAGNTGNNPATPMTPSSPITGVPDLVTTIGQPATPFVVGSPSNVPVTVTNVGSAPATGPIATTITLPTGMSAPATFTSGANSCSTSGQTVTCTDAGPLSNVAPNNTSVIQVPMTPSPSVAGTSPQTTATTSAPNEPAGNTGNNPATPMTPSSPITGVPDLVTTIGQPATPFVVGSPSNVPVTVTNVGSAPATGPIATTITLPTGMSAPATFTSNGNTCTTSGQTVSCSNPDPLSNVAPNNTNTIQVPMTPSPSIAGTSPQTTATTSAPNEPAGNTGNNPATPMTPSSPITGVPDLVTTIGQPATPFVVGSPSNVPVTVTNVGSAPATGPIATTITLPTGMTAPATFTSNGNTCTTSGQTVSCSNPDPLSNVAPNNTNTIQVPMTPTAAIAGTSPQTTATTSAPNEPAGNTGNNPATPMTPSSPITGVPDLVTTIGQPATPFVVGSPSNVPVTVTNVGSAPATGPIATTITLPTGMTAPATFTSNGNTCTTSGQTVSCSNPDPLSNVAPNNTNTIQVPMTPTAAIAGTSPQTTATTSAPNEPVGNTGNNPASPMTPSSPITGVPDLVTTIGQPATPFVVGSPSNVPVTVTNVGSAPATGPIATTITLPTGMTAPATFTSNGNTCTTSGQTVSCSNPDPLSNVAPNNTNTIQVPMTPSPSIAGTSPQTTATTSAPNEPAGNTGNNPATPMTPSSPITGVPDLVTTIGQPATPFVVGSPSNVPVTVTNVGSAPATGPIATTITLPTGMTAPATFTSNGNTCTTSGQTVSCSNPDLLSNVAPNNTNTIQVPMTPTAAIAGTSPQTTATTSAPNEPVGNTGNNPATPMTPSSPITGVPDLVTTIGQPATPFVVGSPSNVPVTVTNVGSAPATGPIATTITLPTGMTAPATFTSNGNTCTTSGQTVSCSNPDPLSNVAPNNTNTIQVPMTPTAAIAGTSPQTTATTSAPNEPAGNTGNNPATPMTPSSPITGVPDLVTTIGQPATPFVVGSPSNVPVTVTNVGSAPATGPIATTITLPTGMTAPATFTSNGNTCTTSGQTVSCSNPDPLSNVAPNNTNTIQVPMTPTAAIAGTSPQTTATTSAPNEPAGNTGNNPATPMTPSSPITGVPDLVTTIGQPATPFVVGSPSNVPVTVTNVGSAPATGPIATTITLPTGMTAPATFTSNGNTCTTSGQTVSCSNPDPLSNVAPNNTNTIQVPMTPTAAIAGTSPQTTATTSAPNEPAGNTGNNPATPMTPSSPITGVPDLVTTIGQPATPFVVGSPSNVPVTVTNVGSAPATGPIATTITLPTGMTAPATFTSNGNTCTTSGQTVSCSNPDPLSNVAPNNTNTIQVPMTPTAAIAGTSPQTTATTSAPNEPAGNTGNNPATPMTPSSPITGVPDLVTTIGQPATPFVVGSPSNVPVTVTNVGSAPATGPIATTITLPTGMTAPATFTSNGNTCTTSGQTVSCSNPDPLSNVAPNNTNTIQVPMTPTAAIAGTSPQTTATTSAPNEPAGNTGNNPASPMTPSSPITGVPDLVTTIGQPATPFTAGQASNVPVTVTNIGSGVANGPIETTITLPTGTSAPLTFTSGTNTCSTSGQTVVCTDANPLSNVAPNNSSVIQIPVTPSASIIGTNPSPFTATPTAPNEPAANTGNNAASPMTPTTPVAPAPVTDVKLNIKVYLQGAYNSTNGLMRDDLRVRGFLPTSQPYSALARTSYHTGAELTTTGVLSTTGVNAIVDWVLIELRTGSTAATRIATRAALVQRDGDVVDVDGFSPVQFNAIASGNYYVVITHRNHLGVMSDVPVALSSTATLVDFTAAYDGYGTNAQKEIGNINTLWAGNANHSGITHRSLIFSGANNDPDKVKDDIITNSSNSALDFSYIATGYKLGDTNLDGDVKYQGPNNDIDTLIFFNILQHPSNTTPSVLYIINEQH